MFLYCPSIDLCRGFSNKFISLYNYWFWNKVIDKNTKSSPILKAFAQPFYTIHVYYFETYVKKSAGRGRRQRQSLSWSTRPTLPWCSLTWRASLRPPVTHSCNHRNTLGKSVNPGALFVVMAVRNRNTNPCCCVSLTYEIRSCNHSNRPSV